MRDSTNAHHNKLEKSPHARRASLTSGRKTSLRKAQVEEDASTRAMAGSASRLNQNNADANESTPVPPLTPKSIRNDDYEEQELHNVVQHALPPTPPAQDDPFARGGAGGYHVTFNGDQTKDGSNKSNLHAATATQDTNPSAKADNLRANPLGTEAVVGTAGLGMSSRAYGVDQRDESGDWASDGHQGHDLLGGGTERAIDIATARKKIQFAVEVRGSRFVPCKVVCSLEC